MAVKQITLIIMALLYGYAGINHFIMPKFYLKITPPYLPFPKTINIIAGVVEVLLAIMLLIPDLSHWAAWGIIALLVAVFPANIYHYQKSKGKMKRITLIRMPIQGLLIWWAYWYTY